MFLKIDHLDEMKEALKHKSEIAFNLRNGVTNCSYIVATERTFDCSYSREARGIVFGSDGSVISRPLHKFFNVNERAETQANVIPWDRIVRVMNKRDGSMIHTVKVDGDVKPICEGANFDVKTKKSFESDVALKAKKWLKDKRNYINLCSYLTENGYTAIFEYTAPDSRIVVYYKEELMKLLHVRHNQLGHYLTEAELKELCERFDVPLVENDALALELITQDPSKLFEHSQNLEGVEGWVLQFDNGEMVKLKTKWYMNLHHAMTFLRERDVAKLVVDEALDDLKAKLVGEGVDISKLIEIENRVLTAIKSIQTDVEEVYNKVKDWPRLEIVNLYRSYRHFKMLMFMYSGKETDFKEYFRRYFLDEMFGLNQLNLENM